MDGEWFSFTFLSEATSLKVSDLASLMVIDVATIFLTDVEPFIGMIYSADVDYRNIHCI